MKNIISLVPIVAGSLIASAGMAVAADCGDVTVSNMNWQSAEVLASIDKFILTEGFGCNVDLVVGDTVPTLTSMAEKGQPDIAPEGWVGNLPEIVDKAISEKKLVVMTDALSDGGIQGWWMPAYIAEAHPDIKTIEDIRNHPELFPDSEDPSKGTVYNGPQGWGGTVITKQFFKAFDFAGKGWTLTDPGSAAGLDGSMSKAYERKEGWVGYYYAPTALLGKYKMVKVEHGREIDQKDWARCNAVDACPDPKPNDWPRDKVQTLVTGKFAERAPKAVLTYLQNRSWANSTVNPLLSWMTENQASGEDGAKHFLKEQEAVWTKWVDAETAEKIKAAL